jgi:hypothetical protein
MAKLILKVLLGLVALGSSSCMWMGSQVQEPVKLHRDRIEFIGKNQVRLGFLEKNGNQLLVTIEWTHSPQGEYSTVGPLKKISVQRDGTDVPVVPKLTISAIEDVDFNSCQLYQSGDEYIIEAYWGVGESLAKPHKIPLAKRKD